MDGYWIDYHYGRGIRPAHYRLLMDIGLQLNMSYVWVVATTPSFLETYEYIEDPTICCSQGLLTWVSSQLSNYQANARYNQQV